VFDLILLSASFLLAERGGSSASLRSLAALASFRHRASYATLRCAIQLHLDDQKLSSIRDFIDQSDSAVGS
jgi:hypothetical protein